MLPYSAGVKNRLKITLNEDVCRSYGITPADVRNVLNQNSRSRTFAGKVTQDNRMIFVNVISEYDDLSDISELVCERTGIY